MHTIDSIEPLGSFRISEKNRLAWVSFPVYSSLYPISAERYLTAGYLPIENRENSEGPELEYVVFFEILNENFGLERRIWTNDTIGLPIHPSFFETSIFISEKCPDGEYHACFLNYNLGGIED